jgi:hypothetical protein
VPGCVTAEMVRLRWSAAQHLEARPEQLHAVGLRDVDGQTRQVRDTLADATLDTIERGPIRLALDDQTHEHASVTQPQVHAAQRQLERQEFAQGARDLGELAGLDATAWNVDHVVTARGKQAESPGAVGHELGAQAVALEGGGGLDLGATANVLQLWMSFERSLEPLTFDRETRRV